MTTAITMPVILRRIMLLILLSAASIKCVYTSLAARSTTLNKCAYACVYTFPNRLFRAA